MCHSCTFTYTHAQHTYLLEARAFLSAYIHLSHDIHIPVPHAFEPCIYSVARKVPPKLAISPAHIHRHLLACDKPCTHTHTYQLAISPAQINAYWPCTHSYAIHTCTHVHICRLLPSLHTLIHAHAYMFIHAHACRHT